MSKMQVRNFAVVLSVGVAVLLAAQSSFGGTVAVGNCRAHLVSYSTISAAVAAVTPNSTVLICPGTYPEQVTITQALSLKGLKDTTGAWPVIAVPSGGLAGGSGAQLSVQGAFDNQIGPVNVSNLIVDGAGSGVDCSTGSLTGIEYFIAFGSLDNVEVRNQNPGGCGYGITAGAPESNVEVSIRNSYIHDFDNTGVLAGNTGAETTLNLTANRIASTSATVQAGVMYSFSAGGLASGNTIAVVGGQIGLALEGFYCCSTAKDNAIVGSTVGIFLGGYNGGPTTIANNVLSNNGTGIVIGDEESSVIRSNVILQSSVVAIDLTCKQNSKVVNNTFFGAPVGVANMSPGEIVRQNSFFSVTTPTTTCSP